MILHIGIALQGPGAGDNEERGKNWSFNLFPQDFFIHCGSRGYHVLISSVKIICDCVRDVGHLI